MSWHIASLVVRCRHECCDAVIGRLESLEQTEVRGAGQGRIVVVVDGADEFVLAERFAAIRALPDVIAADLVHHEIDLDDTEADHVEHAP